MKVSQEFIKAKRANGLSAIVVQQQADGNQIIRLCIDERSKVKPTERNTVYVETPTTIQINECRRVIGHQHIKRISFYESVYGESHIITFLKAIKKDSDVRFTVVAFNGNEAWDKVNFVSHQLYGYVDGNKYFLSTYIGNDNSASPVFS